MDSETLYLQLGELIASTPTVDGSPLSGEAHRWLGRACALVEQSGRGIDMDLIGFRSASDFLVGARWQSNWHTVQTILYRAFARAELAAPLAAQGTFLPIGGFFTLYEACRGALGSAKTSILLVDPYIDNTVLARFGALIPPGVSLRLLSNTKQVQNNNGLIDAICEWKRQFSNEKPVEFRLAPPSALHDRVILVDGGKAGWVVGQSVKDATGKSPTYFLKLPGEILEPKASYYEQLWSHAEVAVKRAS